MCSVFRLGFLVGAAVLSLVLATVGVVHASENSHHGVPRALLAARPVPGRLVHPAQATPVRKNDRTRTKRRPAKAHPARTVRTSRVQSGSRGCPAGLVALTFDDGPRVGTTRTLVHELRALHAPATFFMVGSRVAAWPSLAELVARSGFLVANHTWDHADLTALKDSGVRRELRKTRRALRAAGVRPSDLARPPYGAVSPRVRHDLHELGLHPVLWTIDSRDWTGGDPAQIASRVLSAVRPHRTNIVLQHDGVDNSPNSVAAVPTIVNGLRQRGYCLATLDAHGQPTRVSRAANAPAAPAQK
jgi:peptidoglycan/xylan/chitin deacetylase (PgdA/CDA1 family)